MRLVTIGIDKRICSLDQEGRNFTYTTNIISIIIIQHAQTVYDTW